MDIDSVMTPALSAAGGALTTGWIAKTLIQNWLKKHDDMASEVRQMLIQVTRIDEKVSTLQRTEERTHQQDRILAVIQTQLAEFQNDLNGVGRKVREMATS